MHKSHIYAPLEYFRYAEYSQQGGERTLFLRGMWDRTGYETPVIVAIATMIDVSRCWWKQEMLCKKSMIDFDRSVTQIGFNFAGVTILCKVDSDVALLERDFQRAMDGLIQREEAIGPYPPQMTAEQLQAEADQLAARNLALRQAAAEERARREAEYEAGKAALIARVNLLPPMEWAEGGSQAQWEAEFCAPGCSQMGEFCEALARLIQAALAQGDSFPAAAEAAWKEVFHALGDVGGSCTEAFAVEHLIGGKWKHADALRRERNAKHGYPDASNIIT